VDTLLCCIAMMMMMRWSLLAKNTSLFTAAKPLPSASLLQKQLYAPVHALVPWPLLRYGTFFLACAAMWVRSRQPHHCTFITVLITAHHCIRHYIHLCAHHCTHHRCSPLLSCCCSTVLIRCTHPLCSLCCSSAVLSSLYSSLCSITVLIHYTHLSNIHHFGIHPLYSSFCWEPFEAWGSGGDRTPTLLLLSAVL
jgi:hypothetical protein